MRTTRPTSRTIAAALAALLATAALAGCGSGSSAPDKLDATITVKGGKPEGGVKKLEVKKGGHVHLTVASDVADEVHLHGYDIHRDVERGGTVTFDFPAKIDGRFEIELEQAKQQLAELTVEP